MEAIVLSVMFLAGTICFVAILAVWNGKDWIQAYWKAKTEALHEERLTAEANAKAAEAKLAQAKINAA
jgi:hypothetical protein